MARDAVKISKNLDDNGLDNEIYVLPSDGTHTLDINADGSINIADEKNSITVDGTVAISGSVTVTAAQLDIDNLNKDDDEVLVWANTAKDGTGTDYVPVVTSDGYLRVDIASGTTAATEYNEDDATPATIVGGATLMERDDALSAVTPAEGDWIGLRGNARGALWVELDLTNDVTIADGGNSITVDGTVAATQSGVWNIGTVASITADVNIADGGNIISVDDGGGTLTVDGTVAATQSGTWNIGTVASITNDVNIADGGNSITVDAVQLDIDNLNDTDDKVAIGDGTHTLDINADGSINVVTQPSSGTPVVDPLHSSLATGVSANHTYTASGGTFEPKEVQVSAESIATFEVLTGPTGSLVSRGYIRTSVENPNGVFKFPDGFTVADTEVVRVVQTNDSNKTHLLDSTITGWQN